MKYLKGEVYDERLANIYYFNVTLDLKKYFLSAEISLSNESSWRKQNITTINHNNIFNGQFYGTFTKCFADDIQRKDLPSNIGEIIYYYNCWQIVGELRLWSWEDSDYPITDITTLAEKGLHDFINAEICVQEIYTDWLEEGGCVAE